MIDRLLRTIAPHYCYGCGEIGTLVCANCKYDITMDGFDACIVCGRAARDGICGQCETNYQKAWCVGDRKDVLKLAIDGLKFERIKQAREPLGDLLDSRLPLLPKETIVVPVPTINRHIRSRGYDHTLLIAKRLAKNRNLALEELLQRKSSDRQRGASRKQRFDQAKSAFVCTKRLSADVPYLLVDDVVTTNATLRYAAQALRDAGASQVWVAVLARQPLDKST